MKKKIVLWGNNANDEKVLIALQLLDKENKVNIHTFKHDIVSEVFYNLMMDDWRSGKEVEFPEGHETQVRELSVTDDILPETLKVQRTDLINRAKAEWHFVVLSTKMYDLYNTELADLKERIDKLIDFDGGIWEEVKGFWSKISEQARERNLFRDHADKLKRETNDLFAKLKEFKAKANEELGKISKEHVANFTGRLDAVKDKVDKGMSLNPLFEELKKIQREFKDTEFTRNDRSKVWKRIDEAFKKVKEKKYGKPQDGQREGAVSRVEKRYQGLLSAIGKMQQSIDRDKRDIDFQNNRANNSMGQLEMQLRQAKVMMVQERITSKQEKLDEMNVTKAELEKRIEKEKAKVVKQQEKKEIEKKKAEVKEKIKTEMTAGQPEVSEEEAERLKKAAAQINKKPKKSAKKKEEAKEVAESAEPQEKESLLAAASAMIGDAVEDVVDSVKAVAHVVGDKVEDAVEDIKEKSADIKEAAADKTGAAKEKVADASSNLAEDKTTQEAKETLAKGGLLAGAVALGSKLVKDASEKLEDISESTGLDKTIDKAKETLKETKEAISDKAKDVAEKAGDVKDAAVEKVADKKEAVADKVEDAKASVKEVKAEEEPKKGGLGDVAVKGGLLGAAIALGSKVAGTVADKVDDVAESLGMDEALDKAKEKLGDAKDAVQEKVEDIKEGVTEATKTTDESVDEVAARVRKEAKGSSEEE